MYKLENEDKWKLDSLKFNGLFVVTVRPYHKIHYGHFSFNIGCDFAIFFDKVDLSLSPSKVNLNEKPQWRKLFIISIF